MLEKQIAAGRACGMPGELCNLFHGCCYRTDAEASFVGESYVKGCPRIVRCGCTNAEFRTLEAVAQLGIFINQVIPLQFKETVRPGKTGPAAELFGYR